MRYEVNELPILVENELNDLLEKVKILSEKDSSFS